jgi:hypothetical protein
MGPTEGGMTEGASDSPGDPLARGPSTIPCLQPGSSAASRAYPANFAYWLGLSHRWPRGILFAANIHYPGRPNRFIPPGPIGLSLLHT